MLIPLMFTGPMVTYQRNATTSQVTASMLMTVKGIGGWAPWPTSKASFDGKVTAPSGKPPRKLMESDVSVKSEARSEFAVALL